MPTPVAASPTPSDELVGDMIIDPNAEEPWLYDASEPRYCVCQNVSYGDMVACDNREVRRGGGCGCCRGVVGWGGGWVGVWV